MASYSVVHFMNENSVEAVPSTWIKNGKKTGIKLCAWPHNKAYIMKYIQNKHMPNEFDFKYFKVRVLKKNLESLTKARDIADDARYRSDFTNTDDDDFLNFSIKNKNIMNSPASSTSSMPIYDEKTDDISFPNNLHSPLKNSPIQIIKPRKTKLQYGWSPIKPLSSSKEHEISKHKLIESTDQVNQSIYGNSSSKNPKEKNKTVRQLSYSDKTPTTIKKNELTSRIPVSNQKAIIFDELLEEPREVHTLHDTSSDNQPYVSKINNNNVAEGLSGFNSNVKQSAGDIEFQSYVNKNMAFLKIELKQIQSSQLVILERLDSIQLQLEDQPRVYDKNISINKLNDCPLPIDNITDLQTFEDKIAGDGEFKTCLVKELTYIGGKHVKAMVRRIMAKLCTDELLQHYSYNGKKGKIPFCSLSICSVIFEAVKKQGKFKNVCQDEIEETIKYVLVQAPFTIKRLLQKTNTKSTK